jgi:hypothetical protein
LETDETKPQVIAAWILSEIERLQGGGDPKSTLGSSMSPEYRATFEIAVIDALSRASREEQHHLRSALIKCGYDEQCARRVMGADVSDRIRASALLALLRPQWRHPSIEVEQRPADEITAMARVTGRTTAPLDLD